MWVNIQETLYNLDKYKKIKGVYHGDEEGEQWILMSSDNDIVKVKMSHEEIVNTMDFIARFYYEVDKFGEPDISLNKQKERN